MFRARCLASRFATRAPTLRRLATAPPAVAVAAESANVAARRLGVLAATAVAGGFYVWNTVSAMSGAEAEAPPLTEVLKSIKDRLTEIEAALGVGVLSKNSAFVFIKPHAVTDKTKALVAAELEARGIKILAEGSLTAEQIDEGKLIDQHYYSIASKATILKPDQLNVPVGKFAEKFGLSWVDALASGKVVNAIDGCEALGLTADEMDAEWGKCKKAGKLVKFGGGFYCGLIEIEGKEPHYVFNGFFMSMRSKFTAPGCSISYYVVEWKGADLSWGDFRGKVLGPTNPEDAPADSCRGKVLAQWEELGLASVPDVGDNGVHASASPFEALAERANWLGADIKSDPFGAALMDAGLSEATIKKWSVDPQVKLDAAGTMGSLFDAVEDLDSVACVEKLVTLNGFNESCCGGK